MTRMLWRRVAGVRDRSGAHPA